MNSYLRLFHKGYRMISYIFYGDTCIFLARAEHQPCRVVIVDYDMRVVPRQTLDKIAPRLRVFQHSVV